MLKDHLCKKVLTASTAIIGSELIEALPITEYQEVLELQAGDVAGHIRGGRSGEVTYSWDADKYFDKSSNPKWIGSVGYLGYGSLESKIKIPIFHVFIHVVIRNLKCRR